MASVRVDWKSDGPNRAAEGFSWHSVCAARDPSGPFGDIRWCPAQQPDCRDLTWVESTRSARDRRSLQVRPRSGFADRPSSHSAEVRNCAGDPVGLRHSVEIPFGFPRDLPACCASASCLLSRLSTAGCGITVFPRLPGRDGIRMQGQIEGCPEDGVGRSG